MIKRVIDWGVYRSGSTMKARAMLQRSDTRVEFEPFSYAAYFGPQRTYMRHADEHYDNAATFDSCFKKLLKPRDSGLRDGDYKERERNLVYCKDFPMCLPRDQWGEAPLDQLEHSFIIRHPAKTLPSMYREVQNEKNSQWQKFDPAEAGYEELLDMYKHVTEDLGKDTVVIDTDDFQGNPAAYMQMYCDWLGLEHDENMMHWVPENTLEIPWQGWNRFYDRAQEATGFEPPRRYDGRDGPKLELPTEVLDAIEEAMPVYEELHKLRRVVQ